MLAQEESDPHKQACACSCDCEVSMCANVAVVIMLAVCVRMCRRVWWVGGWVVGLVAVSNVVLVQH